VRGRKGRHVGVAEQGHVPAGRFRAGDNDPRVGAQQVGAEQPDSQLMMGDERGLSRLDARRSEHAIQIMGECAMERLSGRCARLH